MLYYSLCKPRTRLLNHIFIYSAFCLQSLVWSYLDPRNLPLTTLTLITALCLPITLPIHTYHWNFSFPSFFPFLLPLQLPHVWGWVHYESLLIKRNRLLSSNHDGWDKWVCFGAAALSQVAAGVSWFVQEAKRAGKGANVGKGDRDRDLQRSSDVSGFWFYIERLKP